MLGLAGPANAASGTMYGDPAAAAQWWRHQHYDDCALMASADVVGQMTGTEPTEEAIIKMAQSTPSVAHRGPIYTKPANTTNPNSGKGTNPADIPVLLAKYHIRAVIIDKTTAAKNGIAPGIEGIEQELGAGHKVIVGVNAELIWHEPVENKDEGGNPEADHAVVVTGVDTAKGVVHLNDSGTPDGRDEQVPLALFLTAWATSDQQIIATTQTTESDEPQPGSTTYTVLQRT